MNVRPSLSNGLRIAAVTLTAALLSACGGHSGSGSLPSTPNGKSGTATVKFHIVVPAKSTAASTRKPKYVSADTASATFAVGTTSVTVACTTACDGTLSAPIGSDTFTASLYDSAAPPNLLSQGSTTQTIVAGTPNTVNVTFNPVVAAVSFIPDPATSPALTLGTAGTAAMQVRAEDAAGNTIVGPGTFIDASGNALTFGATLSNDTGSPSAFSAVTGTAAKPLDTIAVSYNGNTPAFSGTLTPTVATGPGTLTTGALHVTSVAPFKAVAGTAETSVPGTPAGIALDPVVTAQVWYAARQSGINSFIGVTATSLGGAGFPDYVASDVDHGALWFTDWGAGSPDQPTPAAIVKVDVTGVPASTSYPLPTGYTNAVPIGITYDHTSGFVWFAQRGFINGGTGGLPPTGAVSAIGKLDPTGPPATAITEINVPGNPYGIVALGANIWFTEDWNDKVGFLPANAVPGTVPTEFSLNSFTGAFADAAKGIATDGTDLWVARQSSSQIAKVTTTGDVTLYALPAGAAPVDIIWIPSLGGKGRVVFTESGTGSIGILDPSAANPVQGPSYTSPITGGLTEIQLPAGPASTPTGLVADGSGGLWVAESGSGATGAIVHITLF